MTPELFWKKVDIGPSNQCWNWRGCVNSTGYGSLKYQGRSMLAHRIAFELADIRGLHSIECVCHHCDNPICCNPIHLFVGSKSDNNSDRHAKGRSRGGANRGAKNPRARLTDMEIHHIFTSPLPPRLISEQYRIPVSYICDIRAGRAWASVTVGLKRGHYGWNKNANARAAERVR